MARAEWPPAEPKVRGVRRRSTECNCSQSGTVLPAVTNPLRPSISCTVHLSSLLSLCNTQTGNSCHWSPLCRMASDHSSTCRPHYLTSRSVLFLINRSQLGQNTQFFFPRVDAQFVIIPVGTLSRKCGARLTYPVREFEFSIKVLWFFSPTSRCGKISTRVTGEWLVFKLFLDFVVTSFMQLWVL